ncbi:MAG TPA: hypothetical protein VHS13_01770 [Edaphobacter sp.]|jgi:hypothetical protein|nr:hypothetical protein [Edaphobacter sp.]
MKRMWCEREADVVRSLRMDSFPAELRDHIAKCVVCTEARKAAGLMLQGASRLLVEDGLPPAGFIWSRAQARRREAGLKRAARPLIVMRVLSVAYVVLGSAWALRLFWRSVSMELASGWDAFGGGVVGFGTAMTLLAVAMGAWYLLYDGRRSDAGIAST